MYCILVVAGPELEQCDGETTYQQFYYRAERRQAIEQRVDYYNYMGARTQPQDCDLIVFMLH